MFQGRGSNIKLVTECDIADAEKAVGLLEKENCSKFQLLECPKLLDVIGENAIREAKEKLQQVGCKQLSAPLIHLALTSSTSARKSSLKKRVDDYIENLDGFCCVIDYWTEKLQLTPEDLEELSAKNARLLSFASVDVPTKKLDLLVSYGISLGEIRQHSHVLLNKSYDVLQKRLEQLRALNLNKPYPLRLIGQAEFIYRYSLARLLDKQDRQLNVADDAVSKPVDVKNLPKGFSTVEGKWTFLIEKGFHPTEIMNYPPIWSIGEKRLEDAYSKLHNMGVEKITLQRLVSYAKRAQITNDSNTMAKVLSYLTGKKLDRKVLKKFSSLYSQKFETVVANYEFLKSMDFEDEHLSELPVILAHDTNLLKKVYNSSLSLPDANLWRQKPVLLLNVMQYFIEKTINFKSPIVLESRDSVES